MLILKATRDSEAGRMPAPAMLAAMGRYHETLATAGVLVDAGGLYPSSRGVRVRWKAGQVTVTDGPFAESKELVGGYWVFEVASMAEAIDWIKRLPTGFGEEVEIRQLVDPADFERAERTGETIPLS
jgi:hypothetical protein